MEQCRAKLELSKPKRVRLKGKALRDLNNAIHERDLDCCINCGSWVDRGVKFHHERAGLKSDVIEECVTLCPKCHFKRHHTGEAKQISKRCRKYLIELYGEDRWND